MKKQSKSKPKSIPGKTLLEFVRAKQRAGCKVCSLPDSVREEIRNARTKKITRRDVLEWLKTEVKSPVADAELTTHTNGHHE